MIPEEIKINIHNLINSVIDSAETLGSYHAHFISMHSLNSKELESRQEDLLRSQTKLIAYIYSLIYHPE